MFSAHIDRKENSHLEWPDYTGFLAVPENKFADPFHFKTLMSIVTREKTRSKGKIWGSYIKGYKSDSLGSWSSASDDLVKITGNFFYTNIGYYKQKG